MFEVISQWVLIDPVELLQSDCLLEFAAFFDEDRRLWPWMFKRRSHWDMAMPAHLYPAIPPPPAVMGPLWQQAAAEAAATPHFPAVVPGQPAGLQPVAVAGGNGMLGSEEHSAAVEAEKPDAPLSVRAQPLDGGRISSSTVSQNGSVRKSLGGTSAAAEEVEMLAAADQVLSGSEHTGMSDIMPLGRLAPLHESAEGSSSKASEADGSHLASTTDAHPLRSHAMPAHLRRYSDMTQQYSRLGPQHLHALQMQYNQSLAGQGSFTPPYGQPYSLPLQQQFSRSGAAGVGGMFPPLPMGVLMPPGYLSSRHRRPSYLSDVSSRYRRFSNLSEFSGQYPSSWELVTPGGTPATPWGFVQHEPSSRRPSALSDFFPIGSRSRRPSNTSQYDRPTWMSMGNNTLSGTESAGSQAGTDAAGVAAGAATALRQSSAVQQQQMQMELQAQQLHRQLQQYQQQQQQNEQQLKQQMQPGAPWRWQMVKMQRAASGSNMGMPSADTLASSSLVTAGGSDQGKLATHCSAPSQLQIAAAGAGGHSSGALASMSMQPCAAPAMAAMTSRHVSSLGGGLRTPMRQQGQHQQLSERSVHPRTPAVQSSSGTAAPSAAATPGAGDRKSSRTGSGGNSGPLHASDSNNTGSRDSSAARQSTQSAVPAALLMQGLESQVLPGMLHSSNRLRLVSKRRRQMSYCFFQETSKPGLPADGADPKRLVGFSSSYGVPLGPHTGTASSPHSNYAASDAAGSVVGVPPAGLSTIGSGNGSVVTGGKGSAGRFACASPTC